MAPPASQDEALSRYSVSGEDSIKLFVNQLNTVSNITITIIGKIEELKQQDYKGKRVHISISDGNGIALTSKMDIGIHKDLDITQEEYCFDICFHDDGASLLMNSKEQILVEKLKLIVAEHVFELVLAEQSVIHKDTGELAADSTVEENCSPNLQI